MLNVLRWDATGKPDALVVLCHGVGADASQMAVFVDAWAPALSNVAFMAPDGAEAFDQVPPGFDHAGRQWFSLRDRTPAVLDAGAHRSAPLLDAAIDAECARLAVPRDRVVLGGFSQGAMMVLHAGLRRRPAPLAILGYSGALLETPQLEQTLSGRPPVLLVHGESDGVVPFARGPEAAATLRRLGLPVQTCWRPGVEHAVDPEGLRAGAAFLKTVLGHASPVTSA